MKLSIETRNNILLTILGLMLLLPYATMPRALPPEAASLAGALLRS